jgi:hypothetical protein
MNLMPIDLAQVDWLYIIVLAVFAFVASFAGDLLSFSRRWVGAVIAALLFSVIFVFWTYYPHGLPLPTSTGMQKSTASAGAPAAAPAIAPARPANPVKDITPPDNSR